MRPSRSVSSERTPSTVRNRPKGEHRYRRRAADGAANRADHSGPWLAPKLGGVFIVLETPVQIGLAFGVTEGFRGLVLLAIAA